MARRIPKKEVEAKEQHSSCIKINKGPSGTKGKKERKIGEVKPSNKQKRGKISKVNVPFCEKMRSDNG